MTKRIISIALCFIMLFSFLSFSSFAKTYDNPFLDVKEGKWFTNPILWAYSNGYFSGTGKGYFSPEAPCTRAQIATVLAKYAGVNKNDYKHKSSFSDVAGNEYYAPYVNWASENSIMNGISKEGNLFGPDNTITREELCVIFKAYIKYKGIYVKERHIEIKFSDDKNISKWAKEAVKFAQMTGLIAGDNQNNVSPKNKCLRNMAAVMIKALDNAINSPIVVAYYNASQPLADTELDCIDVLNYHPATVTSSKYPFINSIYSNRLYFHKENAAEQNPSIKFLFTLANGNLNTFEQCLYPYETMHAFGDAIVEIVEKYDFDGVDIDYEFPSTKALRENFVQLCKYIREKLTELSKTTNKEYLFSLAIPAGAWAFDLFDLSSLAQYVDYFNIMNYDVYCGTNFPYTHHHTPPYDMTSWVTGGSVAADIQLYLDRGISADKIVPGCGMYSRDWLNVENINHGLFQKGNITIYNYHYSDLLSSYIGEDGKGINGYTRYWDDTSKAPYLYNPEKKHFISYDDEESVSYKVDLIKEHGVRGIMLFDYCTCDGIGFFTKLRKMINE